MSKLTAKQESVIRLMTESEELERHGFQLLLKREGFEHFFDSLKQFGLFDGSRSRGPIPAGSEGSFQIPYWPALDYLTAVATLSGENADTALATKVLEVLRSVSNWKDAKGNLRHNYLTSSKFAEILGLVPTDSVTPADLACIPLWLNDPFHNEFVILELDKGLMKRLLSSPSSGDWEKAIAVVRHCTSILWPEAEKGRKQSRREGYEHWLNELVRHHAKALGTRTGRKAVDTFIELVRKVFDSEIKKKNSSLYRPAVEDHFQNYRWHAAENISVEGLRDALLGWSEHEPDQTAPFLKEALGDDQEIVRRIAIFVIGKRWTELKGLYSEFIGSQPFATARLHELYELTKQHFKDMSENEKTQTLRAIEEIPSPAWSNDPARSRKQIQLQWLSAIEGKGYAAADKLIRQVKADLGDGEHPVRPKFGSDLEVKVGPGPTPYTAEELVGFAEMGTIVENLNSFQEEDPWRGPTVEGLVSALEEAAQADPEVFLRTLDNFLTAKIPFQHAVIQGLKRAWESSDEKYAKIDWDDAWRRLVAFFERLVAPQAFWEEKAPVNPDFVPTRDWVVSAIPDFLKAGTQKDERAYSSNLLPRTRRLIEILLDNAEQTLQPPDDPMLHALNSSKGRAVEALFSHALRACRLEEKQRKSHLEAWTELQPIFDAELEKCQNSNYEFSTLAGTYLAQLDYMGGKWTKSNIGRIFPSNFVTNSICAIDGLSYGAFTRPVYTLLAEGEVFKRALKYELKGRDARGRLIERIGAAYLWGIESLESSNFNLLFGSEQVSDLVVVARLFWTVRAQQLTPVQKKAILAFWKRCIVWSHGRTSPPSELLAALSSLSCYLDSADGEEGKMLEAVAPYVPSNYGWEDFIEQLLRLLEISPAGVSAVLRRIDPAHVPYFDYQNRFKSLLQKLAKKEGMRAEARDHAERFHQFPGMLDVYRELDSAD